MSFHCWVLRYCLGYYTVQNDRDVGLHYLLTFEGKKHEEIYEVRSAQLLTMYI